MNRHTGSQKSQPAAQPPRNPTPDANNQRRQHTSAGAPDEKQHVEGEGSYTATHRYNEGVREHLEHHDVESEAEAARKALEGDERAELERAEQRGKSRAAEQEPSSRPNPSQH
jgi:hypothetical protein